jgi:hypothetical protein
MERRKMPRSIRKFIRREKARIRREVLDIKKQGELIAELYKKIVKEDENKRNLQSSNK